MKIVIVSSFYSEGMGYSENNLPKALASLGHEVHVLTSNLNVYGTSADYPKNYESFLGPADQGVKTFSADGYTVHRLPSKIVSGYVRIRQLYKTIKALAPDIVQSTGIASLNTYRLAAIKPLLKFKLFAENHQHMSVVKPFLKDPKGNLGKRMVYRLTRTLPTAIASGSLEKCYAIAPDCAEVANLYYGVPQSKIAIQPLGTDTDLFRPAVTAAETAQRSAQRKALGYTDEDIVCIYTGRFTKDKNPLLLAKAVDILAGSGLPFHSLFIGEGAQYEMISQCRNSRIISFMKHTDLADYYRLADMGIWPTQESLSMLDAASAGLPLIVSDRIGERERVTGNGSLYKEGDAEDLARVLKGFADKSLRLKHGATGREKMINHYSWIKIAKALESDYLTALGR